MKVLLVGNYEFDGSTSMKIWANALLRELRKLEIDVMLITPKPLFGRIKQSKDGLGKWFGYIDRFLLFPRQLRAAAAKADVIHLCDHGSAMYASVVKAKPVLVTCNDMLAVRGALGEVPDCPASLFGRQLQLWICKGLEQATRVACISQATFDDARRILRRNEHLGIILDALNYPFQQISAAEVSSRLAALPEVRSPFILHVGSNHARKNRACVLRVFAKVVDETNMQMVFAGEALNRELIEIAKNLRIYDKVVQVANPDVEIIEALYNGAVALLFPSRYEGFGWPPIEAQACGCPVVASAIPPLVEVLGESAGITPLDDEEGMAEWIRRFATNKECREQMQRRGIENVRSRFQTSRMMDEYVLLYRELASRGKRL
ncbi:MAG: glycosyltransferase family 4 protein [Acidobacteriota bacterium]